MASLDMTTSAAMTHEAASGTTPRPYTHPLAIVTTLFFMWGFLTSLNDILIPHLKSIFDLSYAGVMLVQFAFFSAYFLFSLPWSKIVSTIGYQATMVAGLLSMAVGALLFVPAATSASFPLFLCALVVLAAGITGLQVAANPYVVVLGKPETASSRLDLAQAFNSLGTTIAPLLGGLLILSAGVAGADELHRLSPHALHLYRVQQAATVKTPYIVIGATLALLAVAIGLSSLPKIDTVSRTSGPAGDDSVWHHPNLMLGALGIFAYVGAEVSIGSFLVNYLGQSGHCRSPGAGRGGLRLVLLGWRYDRTLLGAPLLRRFKTGHLLAACAVCTASLVGVSMATTGHIAMWSILAVGLFNSIMFPSIFALGVAELGPLTGRGSGVLNMAIVGGAILPLVQGVLADQFGLHHAFIVPVVCYGYIVFYGLSGSTPNSQRHRAAA